MPALEQWRRYYDGWAGRDPKLASTGHGMGDGAFAMLGRTLADWLQLRGDEHVLDVGCASGTLTAQWASRAGSGVGVDFSAALVAEARTRHGGGSLHFEVAEAAALPFGDGVFDRIVCFNVLLSLPDHDYAARALAELRRVAAPDARIVLGSLPELACRDRFFEVLLQDSPAWRRFGSKVKTWLRPQRARPTQILWFDVDAIGREFAAEGWHVAKHDDPPFHNYRHYRKTLVLSRGALRPED